MSQLLLKIIHQISRIQKKLDQRFASKERNCIAKRWSIWGRNIIFRYVYVLPTQNIRCNFHLKIKYSKMSLKYKYHKTLSLRKQWCGRINHNGSNHISKYWPGILTSVNAFSLEYRELVLKMIPFFWNHDGRGRCRNKSQNMILPRNTEEYLLFCDFCDVLSKV